MAGKWSPRSTVPAAIFLHIQGTCGGAGTTAGSLQHWARRGGVGGVQASSSVMVQEDGSLLRVIEDCNAPWTNGDFSSGTERGWQLRNRMGGGINSNDYSLTIEAEGGPANDLTVDDIYRHADRDQTTRCFCPGTYFDGDCAAAGGGAVMSRASEVRGRVVSALAPLWRLSARLEVGERLCYVVRSPPGCFGGRAARNPCNRRGSVVSGEMW